MRLFDYSYFQLGAFITLAQSNLKALYFILICRWVLLFAAGLVYCLQNGGNLADAGLPIVSIAYLTFSSWALLQLQGRSRRSFLLLAITADLIAGMLLLEATGTASSPFLPCCLAGLLMLKLYARRQTFHIVAIIYMITPALLTIHSVRGQSTLLQQLMSHSGYLICVLLFYLVVLTEQRAIAMLTRHMRSLAKIYSPGSLHSAFGLTEAASQVENALRKILHRPGVWLCIDTLHLRGLNQSWVHAYYANRLAVEPLPSAGAYIKARSPIGEMTPFYVRKLRDGSGKRYGWLLMESEAQGLSTLDNLYIRLMLMRFSHYYETGSRLTGMQEQAVALERDSIAQDIHDGIAQELFFQSVQLYQLKMALQREEIATAMGIVSEIESKVKESHRQIREFIVELKGEKRKYNLRDAIERMLQRIVQSSGVSLTFRHTGWVAKERIEIEDAIYHMIEEAAHNVLKHAAAGRLLVQLEVTSVQWSILVQDDGKGMAAGGVAPEGKLGIKGMRNRIESLGGTMLIQSEPSQGTSIRAVIPRERSAVYV